jgi:hypothetical protein
MHAASRPGREPQAPLLGIGQGGVQMGVSNHIVHGSQ